MPSSARLSLTSAFPTSPRLPSRKRHPSLGRSRASGPGLSSVPCLLLRPSVCLSISRQLHSISLSRLFFYPSPPLIVPRIAPSPIVVSVRSARAVQVTSQCKPTLSPLPPRLSTWAIPSSCVRFPSSAHLFFLLDPASSCLSHCALLSRCCLASPPGNLSMPLGFRMLHIV